MGGAVFQHFERPSRLIVTGQSTSGKTTLAVDIILTRIMSRVNRCFAVCPTWYDQEQLGRLRDVPGAFPRRRVFTQVDDTVFEHIYRKLRKRPAPTLLFVDDAAAERATNKGNKGSFSRLCLASPHLQLYIVGVFQRLTAASPSLRDNSEGLISFTPSRIDDVDVIASEFNPHPAAIHCKDIVKRALTQCWDMARFAFIWREPRLSRTHFYQGLDDRVCLENEKGVDGTQVERDG